ncbi:MAG TPA: hypothetical protein VFR40_03650 [Lapillicoccus sp.]|nr:hypothetical protein [Lapillicoccus sp.]
MPLARAQAVVPDLPAGQGAYESFFLKLAAPEGGRAFWVRYTTLRYADGRLTGALWFTGFGPSGPIGLRRDADHVNVPADGYVELAGNRVLPGAAYGELAVGDHTARWDLAFDDGRPPFRHLRPDRLYAAGWPRTKLETLNPASTFTGWVRLDGTETVVDGWRGMVGHNWGAEHAEQWIWLQGNDIGADDCHLDIGAGRVLVRGRLSPWVANGLLVLDGEPVRLGGLGRLVGTSISSGPEECTFRLRGRGVEVAGLVQRRPAESVAWDYDGPEGEPHTVVNSSIADLSLTIRGRGSSRHLALLAGAVYEDGGRGPRPGVPAGESG